MAFNLTDARLCLTLSDLAYVKDEAVLRDWLGRAGVSFRDRVSETSSLAAIINRPPADTQAFFAEDQSRCYIAFRGSEFNFEDWITNFSIDTDPEPAAKGDELHQGFYKALTGKKVAGKLAGWVAAAGSKPVVLTGHSLGGALAAMLAVISPAGFSACYTFGQPRIGRITRAVATPVYRVVNRADVVPHVPADFNRLVEDSVPGLLKPVLGGLLDKLPGKILTKANDFTHKGLGTAFVITEDGKLIENGEDAYVKILERRLIEEIHLILRGVVKGKAYRYSGSLIGDHFARSYAKALRALA